MLQLLNLVLCLIMLGLAIAQVGRPNPWLLSSVCAGVALWAFLVGFRYRLFQSVQWLSWLWASVAGCAFLVWQHWPQASGFWRLAVWSRDEAARDGLLLMLALAVLAVAVITAYRKRWGRR